MSDTDLKKQIRTLARSRDWWKARAKKLEQELKSQEGATRHYHGLVRQIGGKYDA